MKITFEWRPESFVFMIVIAVFLVPPSTAGTDYLTVDDVVNLESASDFDFSIDGAWAVWVKTAPDKTKNKRKSNIYLSRVSGDGAVQLTRNSNDRSPKFSPDGGRVAFLSDRGKNNKTQVYVLDLRGGEAERLTDVTTGVSLFEWLDNDNLIFTAREDSTLREFTLKEKKDDTIVVSDQDHYPPVRLYRYSVKEKEIKRITTNQGVITEFALSPNGKMVVTSENQDIDYRYDNDNPPKQFLIDLESGRRREICAEPRVDPYDFEWDNRGRGFYCRRRVASDSTDLYVSISELYYYSVALDRLVPVDLGWDKGLGRGFEVVGDGVVAALAHGTVDRVVHARADGNGRHQVVFIEFDQPVRLAGATRNGNRIVYLSSRASSVPEVRTATVEAGRLKNPQKLIDLNEPLRKKTLSRTEIVRWAGALGDTVEGILYYPPAYEEATKYPLVCLLHGGPSGVDPDFFTERWSNYPHVLSAQGAFVLKVNYHGSGNYGLGWVESIKNRYYELEIPDILSGIDFLIARGFVDENKLGLMGWSNGSILAIACCLESDRFKALCAGAGDVNWTSDYGNCAFGAGFDDAYFGGPPWENQQIYIDKSPLFRMQRMTTPTLIMFGTEDTSVPTEQGWQHFRAMQRVGKAPARFLLFPGAGHGLSKLSHQKRKMEEELAWFDTYLFQVHEEENEVLDDHSLLAIELEKTKIARKGAIIGKETGALVVPEIVEFEGMRIGRFEVTRAQFSAFDPNYTYPPATDNHPVNRISLPMAQAYCLWLSEKTGRRFRLPNVEEMDKLLAAAKPNLENENNLERWVGRTPTPGELPLLRTKIEGMEKFRLLIEPVGSFKPVGASGVYDLGGNVAEWVTDKSGKGTIRGLSAVSTRDTRGPLTMPPLTYIGFRVLED